MEEEIPITVKRNFEGLEVPIAEEQRVLMEKYTFPDFEIDIGETWVITDKIACDAENPKNINGFVFCHAVTLRPMIIISMPSSQKYYIAAMERLFVKYDSVEEDEEIIIEGEEKQEFQDHFFRSVISGENIGEQMSEIVREIESHYSEQMDVLDANLIEMTRSDLIYFARTGKDGGDPDLFQERKIVKAKKQNSDKM